MNETVIKWAVLVFALFVFIFLEGKNFIRTDELDKLSGSDKVAIRNFVSESQRFQSLVGSDERDYNVTASLKIMERYLLAQPLERHFGKAYETDVTMTERVPCAIPEVLKEIYRWHDGVDMFINYDDLLSFERLQENYEEIVKLDMQHGFVDKPIDFVPFIVSNGGDGLAYKCGSEGVFAFYRNGYDEFAPKQYYSIAHFLAVTAEAYKQGAYYFDYDRLAVDEKKLAAIQRSFYSHADSVNYRNYLNFLGRQSDHFRLGSDTASKMIVLETLGDTYDETMLTPIIGYLQDNSTDVVSKALFEIGRVGGRDAIATLFAFSRDQNVQFRNIALVSLAELVDGNDTHLLRFMHPLLKDDDQLVRLSATSVIGRIASGASLPYLMETFENERLANKMEIAEAFGRIGSSRPLSLLEDFLAQINAMDSSKGHVGGFRGDDPHPTILKKVVETAIGHCIGQSL